MSVFGLDAASVGLALGAGMLAAVNPCGFALLPAYLATFVLDPDASSPPAAVGRALRATAALTLGFAGIFLLFGLLILPVAASVQAYLPAFTVVLGIALAVAGVWVAAGRKLPAPRLRGTTSGGPITASWRAMTGFGVSYALASLGCTLAPFLAVVLTSFRADNPLAGVALFVVYAGGMGLTVGVAATAVALARRQIVTSMRRASAAVPRIAGTVLAASGLYVAWYGIWELRVLHLGAGADPIVDAAGQVRAWLAATVSGAGWLGAVLALALLVGVALLRRPKHKNGRDTTMTMQAVFNGVVIAESDDTVVVEGNHYFPRESLDVEFVETSGTRTTCAWKGVASYYTVNVNGSRTKDAVWYYDEPSAQAHHIKDRVAFWKGVEVRLAPNQSPRRAPEEFDAPEGATC